MSKTTRKDFIVTSGVAAGVLAAGSSRVLSANERVQVALIGCGGRGRLLARGMIDEGADIAALCDLHDGRRAEVADFLADAQTRKPKMYRRIEETLADKEIDAVIVATPDHWHGPAAILACQAGKDVYVEKPHAHNIWESRKMIEAARANDRVLQVGTQNRSAPYVRAAREYLGAGKLGEIPFVKVYNLKPGGPFRLGDPGAPPKGFDWNEWLGPAAKRPYHQNIFKRGWHHLWDFSGGDMVDDGIHQLDLAMLLAGDPGLPNAVSCSGGRLVHTDDDSERPDLQVVTYDFDTFTMTFELSGFPPYMRKTTGTIRRNDEFPYWTQNATRIELYGSEYMMTVGRHGGGWQVTTSGGKVVEQMYGKPPDGDHQANFLECVKTRQRPNADIETAHPACVVAHLGNIAYRVGNRKLRFDAKTERFIDDAEANKLIKRDYRKGYEPA